MAACAIGEPPLPIQRMTPKPRCSGASPNSHLSRRTWTACTNGPAARTFLSCTAAPPTQNASVKRIGGAAERHRRRASPLSPLRRPLAPGRRLVRRNFAGGCVGGCRESGPHLRRLPVHRHVRPGRTRRFPARPRRSAWGDHRYRQCGHVAAICGLPHHRPCWTDAPRASARRLAGSRCRPLIASVKCGTISVANRGPRFAPESTHTDGRRTTEPLPCKSAGY